MLIRFFASRGRKIVYSGLSCVRVLNNLNCGVRTHQRLHCSTSEKHIVKALPVASDGFPTGKVALACAVVMGCLPFVAAFLRGPSDESESLQRQLLKGGTHDTSLPTPGEIIFHDFRNSSVSNVQFDQAAARRPLRVVQWNIERGYQLESIIEELSLLNADIIALQEIDIGCDRSNNQDVGVEIARRLGMNYVFLCEFTELRSQARSVSTQGGGCHGNGILTRFDIASAECIKHQHHPVPWEDTSHVLTRAEPRLGERVTLAATILTPYGPVVTYSVHLEVFCGPLGRMRQFADVLQHARRAESLGTKLQLICGDLNTMGHGIARLSPFHCTDHLRWATLGQHEAQVWQANVFDMRDEFTSNGRKAHAGGQKNGRSQSSPPRNERVWRLGLHDEDVCRALVNPGFEEVFPIHEPTLNNPTFRFCGINFMEGKLDWLLHRGGFSVVDKAMGNHDYQASDHKWLAADMQVDTPQPAKVPRVLLASQHGAQTPKPALNLVFKTDASFVHAHLSTA